MPVDRGAIDAQLREIGEGERWWEQREFRDLPHILFPDERILGMVNGKLLGRRRPRVKPSGRWLIIATDQRLLCLKQERFARKQVEIPAGQIMAIRQSSGLRTHQMVVETPQRRYRIRVPNADAFRFSGALRPLIPSPAAAGVHAEEPWAWIPGMSTVAALTGVSAVYSRVSMLSPPEYATREQLERLGLTVERLQHDVERLQQQVEFLEDLLQKRAEQSFLSGSAGES